MTNLMTEGRKNELRDVIGLILDETIRRELRERGLSENEFDKLAEENFFLNVVLLQPLEEVVKIPDKVIIRLSEDD